MYRVHPALFFFLLEFVAFKSKWHLHQRTDWTCFRQWTCCFNLFADKSSFFNLFTEKTCFSTCLPTKKCFSIVQNSISGKWGMGVICTTVFYGQTLLGMVPVEELFILLKNNFAALLHFSQHSIESNQIYTKRNVGKYSGKR